MRVRLLFLSSLLFSLGGLLVIAPVQAQSTVQPTPRPLYALPDARTNSVFTSNSLARTSTTGLLVATNMLSDTLSIIAPLAGELLVEVPVGRDPRSVAVTPDEVRALVTNRGDNTLTVVDVNEQRRLQTIPLGGLWPYGVVAANNTTAYVTLQGSSEVVVVDLIAGEVAERIPTSFAPTGMALWGDFLYVTHQWSGDLSLIYLPQNTAVGTVSTGRDTGLSPSIDIDITRGIAYLPQTRSNAANPALTFDTTVFPVVSVMQLGALEPIRQERITLDTSVRPVNMPFAAEVDPFREWLYVANAGSNNVSIIDLNTGMGIGNIEVGANPRGMLLNRDNTVLFVHNVLDGTISFVETATQTVLDELPITDLTIPVDILIGAQFFHTASDPRLATDSWISCANCHLDGMSDGRVWLDFPGGPRNTPVLYNLLESPPYNWSGTWDEIADVEIKIRELQAGLGLTELAVANAPMGDPHAGMSLDLDTLVIYMETLDGPQSPFDANAALARRGELIFQEQGCNECHTLPLGTNQQAYDVGTGGTFDTPSVRWLWLSAPYLHDGRARTLEEIFELPGDHQLTQQVPAIDLDALIAYLLTLPDNSPD